LVGLYRPQEGNIFYNQINGKEFDFDELRNQIGFVTQDTQLFAGTIKENLLFVNPNASEEDIQLALKNPALKRCLNVLKKASKQSLAKVD
jgi:ATP-binding cassette subfamily B protein